jgi:purine-nucleoside phosphorylase
MTCIKKSLIMYLEKIKETASYLSNLTGSKPFVGIILGTGLGGLVNEIETDHEVKYEDIPNFPVSTVKGHSGKLIFGKLGGKQVMAMQGRFHFYEGYDMKELTFPVRVMRAMGVENLIVSNACGGVNPDFEIGDLMILDDHVNLFPTNPLMGHNYEELGPRFPDMIEPYDHEFIKMAHEIAGVLGIPVQQGSYAGLSGPCLETPAEYAYISNIGADAVGMSTVPEVIVGIHGGMRCFAMSVITDLGVPGKQVKVTHEDVIEVANAAEPKMSGIVKELIAKM